MKNSINILQIVAHATAGPNGERGVNGPELRTLNAIHLFNSQRYKIVVTYSAKGRLWQDFYQTGVKVIDCCVRGKLAFGDIFKILRIVKEHNIDVVHTQGPGSLDFFAAIAARLSSVGMIVTRPVMIEDLKVSSKKKRIYAIFDNVTLSLADNVVAVSRSGLAQLGRRLPRIMPKTVVIYNGVIVEKFDKEKNKARGLFGLPKSNVLVVGACAQLTVNKGWYDFLEVLKRLHSQDKRVHGLIVGDGPIKSELELWVHSRGLEHYIHFTGHLKECRNALSCLDLYLSMSHREGLSVAILEAMASGLPCIATNVGGTVEQIEDGVNGYVVDKGDIERGVTLALEILNDPVKAKRMGAAGKMICKKKFGAQRMVEEYEKIYERVYLKKNRS